MVQATVNEPVELLVSFVAHHLELGADLVHLYLDQSHPEAVAVFKDHPKVMVTTCDAGYWAKISKKGRPLSLPGRQIANYTHAYSSMTADWLLLCDADEYLVPSGDMGEILGRQAAETDYLRIRVAEKVMPPDMVAKTVFDGTFRLGQPRGADFAPEIYGAELAVMLERVVAGHDKGKSIIRRGVDLVMQVHEPMPKPVKPGSAELPRKLVWRWMPNTYLAHFDALTPLFYLVKLLARHLTNEGITQAGRTPGQRHPSREVQMLFAVAACAAEDPATVTEILHRLTPESMAALQKHGLLVDLHLSPDRIARKHFPDLQLDYSPQAFDAALRVKHAVTLQKMGVA